MRKKKINNLLTSTVFCFKLYANKAYKCHKKTLEAKRTRYPAN